MTRDDERRAAIITLQRQAARHPLSRYRYTQTRKGDADVQKRDLMMAFLTRHLQERSKDVSGIVSMRRAKR